MAEIQMGIFGLTGVDWDSLSDEAQRSVIDAVVNVGFRGSRTRAYGLPSPQVEGDILWGRFAHQTSEQLMDYVHGPEGDQQVPRQELTYEHYWYAFSFARGVALLQQRRLPATKDLSTQEVTTSFADILSQATLPLTGRFVGLRPLEIEQSERELRDLMAVGRLVKVRVRELAGRRVPEGVDLTNPDPDANGVLHEYMDHEFAVGVADVTIAANPDDERADLGRSFYVKAITAAGQVSEVGTEIDDTLVTRVAESRKATIKAEEPLSGEVVRALLDRVAGSVYLEAPEPAQTSLFGPVTTSGPNG